MNHYLTHQEVQNCELAILLVFDKYCKEHALNYSLGGGSLIGAIRHKGFIPWDDDIDVFMVRSEYDKLVSYLKKDELLIDKRYKVFLPFEDDYYYPFVKIVDLYTTVQEGIKRPIKDMGIWVDVFPIDYCGDDEELAKRLANNQKGLVIKYYKCIMKYPNSSIVNIAKNFVLFIYRHIFSRYKADLIRQCNILSNSNYSKYSGTLTWAFTEKDVYPTHWFEEYTTTIFEGNEIQVFKDWDKILTHRYGDYMTLPNESERQSHTLKACYKNNI